MSSQKTSTLYQLGYFNPYSQPPLESGQNIGQIVQYDNDLGFSSTPTAAAVTKKDIHISLDSVHFPQANFPVTESSLNAQPLAIGPLAALTQSTAPPVFISQGNLSISQQIQTDEVIENLLRYGYVVENRVYDGAFPSYFIARTRLGDRVFIRIDDNNYRTSFPRRMVSGNSDIQMEKRSSLVLVPQETKMGVLQCLDHDICAAAFVCNNSICITQRQGPEQIGKAPQFTEENFILRNGGHSFIGGKIGTSIVAYPIVMLSDVLKYPVKTEERVSSASNEIAKVAFARLRSYHEDLSDAIKRLHSQSENLMKFTDEAENNLSNDIHKLSEAYEKIKEISPGNLSDQDQVTYYAIQRGLINKKELQDRVINSIASAYKASGMVRSISEELRNNVDPVLNSYYQSIGLV